MNQLLHTLFGEGKDLDSLQIGCRALVMFFATPVLIKIAGMRSFGQKSAFDSIIVIMLGAILSRAVVGASSFLPTIVGGLVLALTHRLLAMATVYSEQLGNLVKGKRTLLFTAGEFNQHNLRRCALSRNDVMEEVRLQLHESNLESVQEIYMECSGKLSIIKQTS